MTYTKTEAENVKDAIQSLMDNDKSFKVGTVWFVKTVGGYMSYVNDAKEDDSAPTLVISGKVFKVTVGTLAHMYADDEFYVQIQFRDSGYVQVRDGEPKELRRNF